MAEHIDLGRQGEVLAEAWLAEKGFTILHRNWRYSHYEIDIIALKNELLHFVEVKHRSSGRFGQPEESVNRKKIKFLLAAADQFLFKHPEYTNFHIDILSIVSHFNAEPEYFFIEDIYL